MLNLVRLFLKLSTFNQRFNLQIIRQLFFSSFFFQQMDSVEYPLLPILEPSGFNVEVF